MPITSSAKKALRQSIKRHALNLKKKKALDTTVKKYKKLIASGKRDEAGSFLPKVYQALDKTTKANIIKAGKADRLKSRLAKQLIRKSS